MSETAFAHETGVSRETLERLRAYAAALVKWNKAVNLVAPATIPDLWTRHMLDSAQLWPLAPHAGDWIDLGSGAGFPGLVIAILAHEQAPGLRVTLVESDRRKAAFLAEAARAAGVAPRILPERAETLAPACADILSARAFAPLPELLVHAARLMRSGGVALFPKGRRFREEMQAARGLWPVTPEIIPSRAESEGAILRFVRAPLKEPAS